MPTRACLSCVLSAALLLLAGCQRLNYEKTHDVPVMEPKTIAFDPPRYEQKVTVQVSSAGAPVSVYLVRESDLEAATKQITADKAPASPLASKENAEEITLEATVPAKTGYALLIRAVKKQAQVKVKVTGC